MRRSDGDLLATTEADAGRGMDMGTSRRNGPAEMAVSAELVSRPRSPPACFPLIRVDTRRKQVNACVATLLSGGLRICQIFAAQYA